MDDWGSSGMTVAALNDDAVRLTLPQFAEKYGRGFLVTHGNIAHPTRGPTRTRSSDTIVKGSGETTGDIRITIFPVRRRPGNAQHNFVSIGRVDGNDICFNDETVSKFHAYIREEPAGFVIQDAKSRNGTSVEGAAVAQRGAGPPARLASGQTVRVGSVAATFLDAGALVDFVKRLKTFA